MQKLTIDVAFERLVGHEGELSMDPKDRGNWTSGKVGVGLLKGSKYGISAMTYPDLDIKNLTLGQAKTIWRRDFWDRVDVNPENIALVFQLADMAYHSGFGNTIRCLQRAVGVVDDGDFGPNSSRALNALSDNDQLILFLAERLDWLTRLSAWGHNSRGWARRISHNLKYAAYDVEE